MGTNAWTFGNSRLDSGPATMTNAAARNTTTPRASRLCAGLGDRLESMKSCSSGAVTAVWDIWRLLGGIAAARAYPPAAVGRLGLRRRRRYLSCSRPDRHDRGARWRS